VTARSPLRVLSVALAALLAGCSWFGGGSDKNADELACPTAFIAPGTNAYRVFRPGGGTGLADIQFGVKLTSVKSTCKREKDGIVVDTVNSFVAVRNDPDLRQGDFTYFVAVADGQQNILTKRNFTLRVEFDTRQKEMRMVDTIVEHLPLRKVSAGRSYGIVVGLQLSQQELDFNRRQAAPPAQ
jgi:hypothetical protein